MIKLFMTGDNHIGRNYNRFPNGKEYLKKSRISTIADMVHKADTENCDFFVVTGDLFQKNSGIPKEDVKAVVNALGEFSKTVLVLPGNHDYYTEDNKFWKNFEDAVRKTEGDIILLKEFRPYKFMVGEETVVFYPAFCHDRHSKTNNLGWIKKETIETDTAYHIGIAHGAIEGITPDNEQEYYLMTEKELLAIPMDAWLIGHTHIPYPADLKEKEDMVGYQIFNAGTHEQLDFHNRSEGNGFILSICEDKQVAARKYVSGKVRFLDEEICIDSSDISESALKNVLESLKCTVNPSQSVARIKVKGSISKEEYEERKKIADSVLGDFLSYEFEDRDLTERITKEMIREEFPEIGFISKFLEALLEDKQEVQMAYELVKQFKN